MQSMNVTIKLYKQLFSLPSGVVISLIGVSICVIYPVIMAHVVGWKVINLILSFLGSWIVSSIVGYLLLKQSKVIIFRRFLGTTVLGTNVLGVAWVVFATLGTSLLERRWVWNGIIIGAGIIILFNLLVYSSVVPAPRAQIYLAAYIYPVLLVFMTMWLNQPPQLFQLPFLIQLSIVFILMHLSVELFLAWINAPAKKLLGISGIELFQGFIEEWLEGDGTILESAFEKIRVLGSSSVSVLHFTQNDQTEFALIIPEIHPGPFMTLGSSGLPHQVIQSLTIESAVAHGACTHEADLVSRRETAWVVNQIGTIIENVRPLSSTMTKPVRYREGKMTITCQFIGDLALLIASSAPFDSDDISKTVGKMATQTALKAGARQAVFIDSHNSISTLSPPLYPNMKEAEDLINAVEVAVTKAKHLTQYPFRVGFARMTPKDISSSLGLGPGGIAALTFEIEQNRMVYLIIDSNNIIQGLQPKILEALKEKGFLLAEVMTSDTHVVSAFRSSQIGFNPLGEAGGHEKIIARVLDVVDVATAQLKFGYSSYKEHMLTNLKILGNENYHSLMELIQVSFKRAKKTAMILFPLIFLLSILLMGII